MMNFTFALNKAQFMDPVHGGISAARHELLCIDHPLFQRLRHIMQNDVAHYVFCGATQTRFSHSIGVMHVAGKFYRTLIEQYLSEASPEFQLTKEHSDAITYVYTCFRLAALLHDTGHFPFSHEFEQTDVVQQVMSDKTLLQDFWRESQLYQKYAGIRLDESDFFLATHEDYSLRIAHRILSEVTKANLLPVELDDVLCLMEGSSHKYTERWKRACVFLFEVFEGRCDTNKDVEPDFIADKLKDFFASMISGEIDVDKMDYLLRDSYFSGTKYGIYNLDHLLSTLRIGRHPDTGWVGLAILEKGVVALEDFVYSRFQIYQNVWSHKAVVSSKILLASAIKEALDKITSEEVSAFLRDPNLFPFFTDHYFFEKFRSRARQSQGSAAEKLLFRKKLKFRQRIIDPSSDMIDETRISLSKQLNNSDVVHRNVEIKFSRIRTRDFSSIKVLVKAPDGKRQLKQLSDESGFFAKFTEKVISNFYTTR